MAAGSSRSTTDGVAAAALNALNLNWAQIGAALNLPKNQPIQVRIVTTKIPPVQIPLVRPRGPSELPFLSPPRSYSALCKERQEEAHKYNNNVFATADQQGSQQPSNLPNGAKKVASFSLSTKAPSSVFPPEQPSSADDDGGRHSIGSNASASTLSQTEYSRGNSPDVAKIQAVFGPPAPFEKPFQDTRKWVVNNGAFITPEAKSSHSSTSACNIGNPNPSLFPSNVWQQQEEFSRSSHSLMKRSYPISRSGPGTKQVKIESPAVEAGLNGMKPSGGLQLSTNSDDTYAWHKVIYGDEKQSSDHYRYNSKNSSCARVRPYVPKSQRPPQDLPNPKPRYRISPTKTSRKEALAHFDEVAEEIAKDKEASVPTLSAFLASQKQKMAAETSKAAVSSLMSKYCTGFGTRAKPRSEKVLNGYKLKKGTDKTKSLSPKKHKRRKTPSAWASGATCARVRPIPSTFVCARCRPFSGLRKELHWYYFMMHPERRIPYVPKKGHRVELSDPLVGKGRNVAGSADLPLPIQYRFYLQRATKIFLGKSPIHGIGVFAEEDVERGRLVLEYRGQVIRNCLVNKREQDYRRKGLGTYMFALDDDYTVDATLHGSVARFINHSCEPNCSAKIITCEGKKKIVLYTIISVEKGEELCYNYKLPLEQEKIPCLCKRPSCRKFLN